MKIDSQNYITICVKGKEKFKGYWLEAKGCLNWSLNGIATEDEARKQIANHFDVSFEKVKIGHVENTLLGVEF